MNALKNWIITKLINNTAINTDVIYSVIEKCSKGEIENYIKIHFERKEEK